MNDVNELWSSPWLTLQKNLASGFATVRAGEGDSSRENEVQGRPVPSISWLVRARSRKLQVSRRVIQ